MMYSIPIHPKAGIGYCFVVDAENPQHALAVLSYEIRQCLKAGVDKDGDNSSNHLLETLRILRKPWRTSYREFDNWLVNKVEVVPIKAMKVSYDTPLVPFIRDSGREITARLGYPPSIQILPRRKPQRLQRNQGHSESE